jgi:uncharacterized delta-60 repeat protein
LRVRWRCVIGAALEAFFLIVAHAPSAFAAGGDLDTSFAGDGTVTTGVTHHGSGASGVAIQANGKIVVAGGSLGANPKFALARYKKNGSLSVAFGGDGKITTDFTDGFDEAYAVAIQADGKIIAAGGSGSVVALARYNADGTLDPTFGGDGTVDEVNGFAVDMAIQADGKILTSDPLTRYNVDGTLDTTFTGGGVGDEIAIQADARIVTGWTDVECFGAGDCDYWLVLDRFNTDGTPDVTFGVNGEVGPPFAYGYLNDIAIQDDGKIIACGGTGGGFILARYLADGTLDPAFGKKGEVWTNFTEHVDGAMALAIQDDGKIVAAGTANESRNPDVTPEFAVSRYLP